MLTMTTLSEAEKAKALARLASGIPLHSRGRSKVEVGGLVIHTRFCSANDSAKGKYKFNINPNTLSADAELWVCGSGDAYYLLPIALMWSIYEDPLTYVDHTHPEIRVVSVDAASHTITYAAGGKSVTIAKYQNIRLEQLCSEL